MAVRRAVIAKTSDEGKRARTVQVHGLAGELLDGVEHIEPYGLTAAPRPKDADGKGSEALLIDVNGSSMRAVLAASDRRYRPKKLSEGDVALYHSSDDPDAEADAAKCRFTFTGDAEDYRAILKVKDTRVEAKSDGSVVLDNGDSSIAMDKAGGTLTLTLGETSIQLSADGITISGTTITLSAETINLDAATINTG